MLLRGEIESVSFAVAVSFPEVMVLLIDMLVDSSSFAAQKNYNSSQ